jgi:carboxymethylenebutenolidase
VIIHEIFGPQPEIDRVVDRFARAGYAAVAPNLFAHGLRIACIVRAVRAMTSGVGKPVEQILATRDWLCETAHLERGAVGLLGFCMGGGFALSAGRGWGAVSTNYGEVPKTDVMRGIGPVIGCYGALDYSTKKNSGKLQRNLAPLGVVPEIHVFEGVGHSFLTDGHHPVATALMRPLRLGARNPETMEEGWRRIFEFFDRHLAG